MYQDEPFGVDDVLCVKETDDALLVDSSFFGERVWIPKKGVHEDSDVQEEGDEGTLLVEGWLAKDRGWSDD
jgi:hypothetical protein